MPFLIYPVTTAKSKTYDYEKLAELLKEAYALQFSLVVGVSTCLQGYLGQRISLSTPIIHFWGNTSQGKTTALQFAVSVWGKPVPENGMMSTWNATENFLMNNRLANNFALPVALDESSICKFDLTSAIYNISQGINRQRLNKDVTPVNTRQWLTQILSTGEMGLLEQTLNNNGLKARVFEFQIPVTLNAEHSNRVKTFVHSNFGHIGEALIELLEDSDFEDVLEVFTENRKQILDEIKHKTPITDRIADYCSLWMTTAQILQEYLEVPVQPDEIKKILLNHHKELFKTFDTGQALYNTICSYVITHRLAFPERNSTISEYGNLEGLVLLGNQIVILKDSFEKIVKSNGYTSPKLCLKLLDQMGVLVRQRKDTYYSMRTIDKVPCKVITLELNKKFIESEGNII